MPDGLGVGVIGCGNISAAYLRLGPTFRGIDFRACADVNADAAETRAREFGVRAMTVEGLLASPDIDLVVNLTVPAAHVGVSMLAIEAGKHVYSEKPFVLSLAEGKLLATAAAAKGVRIGSAPDTWMGGSHQLARSLVDGGRLGRIVGGTCHVMSSGMEHWHPNPDFFFKPGGGPVLDLAAYYLTNLVQLMGPMEGVAAMVSTPSVRREILSEPRRGEFIDVETPTTVHGLIRFENGALVTFGASWDVRDHGHANMELYGENGTLYVPDPNFFGGEVRLAGREGETLDTGLWEHPFGVPNEEHGKVRLANYRAAGLSDMALGITEGRDHRCSGEVALHVVEAMTAMLESGSERRFVNLETRCERPAALDGNAALKLLRQAPGLRTPTSKQDV